ncbi:MAG: phosphoribosylformylglycinamidine synthase, partial [Gammaproteobacteria bacterium]
TGEAMAMGERTPVAPVDAPASGRLAVTEAITNIAAARILNLSDVALSANWMAAAGEPGEDAALFDTVYAVSQLARDLGICIPVGKDSLSMNTVWREQGRERRVSAPVSVNVTAFAPVADIRRVLTPQLRRVADSGLLLVELNPGRRRLAGSALAQVFNRFGDKPPDLDDPQSLAALFRAVQLLNEMDLILAFHDRSDGGLFVTLCEMAFAGRCGMDIRIDADEILNEMFNEEPGVVIQVRNDDLEAVMKTLTQSGIARNGIRDLGSINADLSFTIHGTDGPLWSEHVMALHRLWSVTSYHMQSLRDNPACAREEFDGLLDSDDPGLSVSLSFDPKDRRRPPAPKGTARPRVAVLREQGVNGQVEMAAAFTRAGFECVDVHMNDLLDGTASLAGFRGIVACGGFSYGDVLGAGAGWARTVLFNPRLVDEFRSFFARADTFGLGVCNGCQVFSHLRGLIPGAEKWPDFARNRSEQFEGRLVMVEVLKSPSILLDGMAGSRIPIVTAHGEGRAVAVPEDSIPVMRFVDHYGRATETYPCNPNGSFGGYTGFTADNGRFTILMPHPERVFLRKQLSWFPDDWVHEESPWMRLFHNARAWVDKN